MRSETLMLGLLAQLEELNKELVALNGFGGPLGSIIEALTVISDESLQGSNQACSDPPDTFWSGNDLKRFICAIQSGLDLVKELRTDSTGHVLQPGED